MATNMLDPTDSDPIAQGKPLEQGSETLISVTPVGVGS